MAVTPAPPPVPGRWHTREDSGLSLDVDVQWWHDGERILHPNIIEAFNRGLRVQPDGKVQLHFGADWCVVEVADCAFTVVAVDEAEGERLSARLSDRTADWLALDTLGVDAQGRLTVRVKGGLAKALFSRAAAHTLVERLELDGERVVARVGARRWPTALTPSALDPGAQQG